MSSTQDAQIVLVPGLNCSTWPDLKWSRAQAHLMLMQARFREWIASIPVVTEGLLAEDGRTVEHHLVLRSHAPTDDWALTLGDVVHNLRSALDGLAWDLAHHDGASPARAEDVYFPICATRKRWSDARRKWVDALPRELINRLEALQPFNHRPEGKRSALELLHALDIRDKHRQAITLRGLTTGMQFSGWAKYKDEHTTAVPSVKWYSENVEVTPGARLLTVDMGAPIEPDHKLFIVPALVIAIEWDGQLVDVPTLTDALMREVRKVIDIVRSGLEVDPTGKDAGTPLSVEEVPNVGARSTT